MCVIWCYQNHPHKEWLSSEQQQQHQEILQLFSNNSQRRGGFCLVMDWISENGFFSTINQGGFTHYTKIKKPDFWKTWFITNYSYWVHPKFRIPIWQILPINKWRNRANGRWFTSLFSVRMQRVDWKKNLGCDLSL